MAENSKIEWTHHTFNPWRGCTKISPGCTHCYAETMSHRNPKTLGVWGDKGARVIAAESYWKLPLKWNRDAAAQKKSHERACMECRSEYDMVEPYERPRVFCASLADVFEDRPELVAPRVRLFHLINETKHLDWLLLTKRPENIKRFHGSADMPRSWPENMPPNVWLGTSVEDKRRAMTRISRLKDVGAKVRFLSIEPLLEDLGEIDLTGIGWVIIGGESGHGARECNLSWIRSIVEQCKTAGVPVFVKQLGARPIGRQQGTMSSGADWDNYAALEREKVSKIKDSKGGNIDEFLADLQIREFPTTDTTE